MPAAFVMLADISRSAGSITFSLDDENDDEGGKVAPGM